MDRGIGRGPTANGGRRSWKLQLSLALALIVFAAAVVSIEAQNVPLDAAGVAAALADCNAESQLVGCADISWDFPAERAACCELNRPRPLPPAAVSAIEAARSTARMRASASAAATLRPDLASDTGGGVVPDLFAGGCVPAGAALIPRFTYDPVAGSTAFEVVSYRAPLLSRTAIVRVKKRAMARAAPATRSRYKALRRVAKQAGFTHPGTFVGPAELAVAQARLTSNIEPQSSARGSLLSGSGVPPKVYPGGWFYRTDTPPEGAGPPLPMAHFQADWGGVETDQSACNANYPTGAPKSLCGHISLVEIDAAFAYKHALAFASTRDARHAAQAAKLLAAWSTTNTEFGLKHRNGPLEAAWACGAAARTAELLRSLKAPGFDSAAFAAVRAWLTRILLPQVDHYLYTITPAALAAGRVNLYGNWHASCADCKLALGVLTDNRTLYEEGAAAARTTITDYTKWGRGGNAGGGRIVGETSETLRDIYHSLFGLGSLLQAAETAWQQDDASLYAANDFALAAAMELHARIINAGAAGDPALMPGRFKPFSAMPKPPTNCTWRWDIDTQLWSSFAINGTKCSTLTDGAAYVLGNGWLPAGFELAYAHYAGRLGLPLPETAKLLGANPVDYQLFAWGASTLTHADTPREAWRRGVSRPSLCGTTAAARSSSSDPAAV